MEQPILHFAHANGFPGQSYRTLLAPLQNQWQVEVLDRLGHQAEFPVNENWQNLVNELLQYLEQTCGDKPVVGVGHKRLEVPTSIIYGESSDVITKPRQQSLRDMGFEIYPVLGGHMFPFEHPEQTRQYLEKILTLKKI